MTGRRGSRGDTKSRKTKAQSCPRRPPALWHVAWGQAHTAACSGNQEGLRWPILATNCSSSRGPRPRRWATKRTGEASAHLACVEQASDGPSRVTAWPKAGTRPHLIQRDPKSSSPGVGRGACGPPGLCSHPGTVGSQHPSQSHLPHGVFLNSAPDLCSHSSGLRLSYLSGELCAPQGQRQYLHPSCPCPSTPHSTQ